MQAILRDAAFVVCHGGTGSLITALRAGCRTIAMPRRFSLGEHYDDHQEEITAAFSARGLVEIALDSDQLGACIERARAKPPVMATTDPAGARRASQDAAERVDDLTEAPCASSRAIRIHK